jgi:amidophosphoribosyltransferase
MNLGQHPRESADTVIVLEKISHFLNAEVQRVFEENKNHFSGLELSNFIESNLDILQVIKKSVKHFDGGFALAGLTGFGSAFVVRDQNSIRPAYFFENDDLVAVASERSPLVLAFNTSYSSIKEIPGGHALLIKQSGDAAIHSYSEPKPKKSCSFERIYFSRSSDPEIYKDRKRLGATLARPILEKIEYKVSETVFSYVPNTSEVAFYGLLEEILKQTGQIPRMEKIIWKDTKARTFITQKSNRNEMVGLVYEPTLDIISNNDLLVIIDDSIVRGTTLRESLLYILNLVNPKEVIFTSTAPIIKYPDCYGINMSSFEEFLSFQAAIQYYSRNENEDLLRSIIDTLKENLTKKEKQEILIKFYAQIPENNFIQDMANIIMPEVFRPKLSLSSKMEY